MNQLELASKQATLLDIIEESKEKIIQEIELKYNSTVLKFNVFKTAGDPILQIEMNFNENKNYYTPSNIQYIEFNKHKIIFNCKWIEIDFLRANYLKKITVDINQ